MKKLIIITLALVTLNGFAQEKNQQTTNKKNRTEMRKDLSPEEMAGIQTKKLTLKLDLTKEQQTKVNALLIEKSKSKIEARKVRLEKSGDKKERPTKDEAVKMRNARLDQQIEMKREMKAILTAEQYVKYENMKPRKHKKGGRKLKKQ